MSKRGILVWSAAVLIPVLGAAGQGGSGGVDIQPERDPPPSRQDGREVDLRPRLTPGHLVRYTMQITSRNQTNSNSVPDLDQESTLKETIGLSMKVIEASDDGGTIELVYESVKLKFVSDLAEVDFDSTRPAPKPKPAKHNGGEPDVLDGDPLGDSMERVLRNMVGTKLTLKLDNRGNIVSITGGEALGGGLGGLGSIPGLGGQGAGPGLGDGLKWMVSGPGQRGTARVGESWTNEDSLGNTPVGTFKMSTKHTLRAFARGIANLAFSGRAETHSEDAARGGGPLGFQLRGARYDGTYQWDAEAGELKEMATDMSVEIEGKVAEAPINMKSESTFTVKRER